MSDEREVIASGRDYPCPVCGEITTFALCDVCWERRLTYSNLRDELDAAIDRESRLLQVLAGLCSTMENIETVLEQYLSLEVDTTAAHNVLCSVYTNLREGKRHAGFSG